MRWLLFALGSLSFVSSVHAQGHLAFRILRGNVTTSQLVFFASTEVQSCLRDYEVTTPTMLGRVNIVQQSGRVSVALAPSGEAAALGSREHDILACVREHALVARWSNDDDYTVAVRILTPSLRAGVSRAPAAHLVTAVVWDARVQAAARVVPTSGTLDAVLVTEQLRSHRDEVAACFHRALSHDRQTPASFEAEIMIASDGTVTSVHVLDDAHVSPVSACVVERVRDWLLGPPVGGTVTLRHRFTADLR